MIDRIEDNHIGTYKDVDGLSFYFYFDKRDNYHERRIAKAILTKANREVIADALIKQLIDELSITCRTEDVTEVWIDVSNVYYPDSDKNDVNMDFYTDYVTQRGGTEGGLMDRFYGFVSPTTIGRYSRKDKKFYEISNSMLSCCELM